MKRLIAVLTILAFVGTWAVVPVASAKQRDPLSWGKNNVGSVWSGGGGPGALEGPYLTRGGEFQWLMLAAPKECIDGSSACPDSSAHLWFYNEACNRILDKAVPLTRNDVEIVPIHTVTGAPRVGNVLVAADHTFGGLDLPTVASNPMLGEMFYIDVNRGIGRVQEMAKLAYYGNAWPPYAGAHAIVYAPPDDGVFFFNTLLVRCPVGASVTSQGTVYGTAFRLGGDMIELVNQTSGSGNFREGYSSTASGVTTEGICKDGDGNCSGIFASAISAFVYDLDENFQESVDNLPCRCIGVDPGRGSPANWQPEVRLSAISGFAATHESYWEMQSANSTGLDDMWTANLNIRLVIGSALNVNFYKRLHHTPVKFGLTPN